MLGNSSNMRVLKLCGKVVTKKKIKIMWKSVVQEV